MMAFTLESTGLSDALVILAFARAQITPVIRFILVGIVVSPYGLAALMTQLDDSRIQQNRGDILVNATS